MSIMKELLMSIPYVFLLGAGASKKAGVPLIDEMTEIFEDKIPKIPMSMGS